MNTKVGVNPTNVEELLFNERNRLVRLCTQLTRDASLSEDLAQETLLIAWHHGHQLRDPTRWSQWVNGIARNLCRNWLRRQRQTHNNLPSPLEDWDADTSNELTDIPDAFNLEVELNRQELALLLDRALAQLPALTRAVLIERYIHESPQAEVAQQLGMSEGAVEARIQRGKLTLRRILTTKMQDEAVALGVGTALTDSWQKTRLWCPSCGQHYLEGRFQQNRDHTLQLRCICGLNSCTPNYQALFDGVQGYRVALTRAAHWRHAYWQAGLNEGQIPCLCCGSSVPIHRATTPTLPPEFVPFAPSLPDSYGVWAQCSQCNWRQQVDIEALAANSPATQSFWRRHQHIHTLPLRLVDYLGAPALLVRFQNQKGMEQLDLIFHSQTLAILNL